MKTFIHTLLLTLILTLLSESIPARSLDPSKCRGLAIEGGGDKGAFQVGAFKKFVQLLDPNQIAYDVVTGVSVGALNAVAFGLYEPGEEKKVLDLLCKYKSNLTQSLVKNWDKITQKKVYQNWYGGLIYGVFFKSGFYDSTPLKKMIDQAIGDQTFKRKVVIGTTNIDDGSFVTFSEKDTLQDLKQGILASASIPGIFPYVLYKDKTLMDGGCLYPITIFDAVNRCKEAGFEEKDIIIDILQASGAKLRELDVSNFNAIQMLIRYLEVDNFYKTMTYVQNAGQNFPHVNFRYLVFPTASLPTGLVPLGFNHDDIVKMINLGESDAERVIKAGPTKSKKIALEFFEILKKSESSSVIEQYDEFFERRMKEIELEQDII